MLSSVTPSQSVSTQSNLTQQHQRSFIPEKDDLWSGILKGVASSKIVPTKNVLILGEPGVGKSTLVHFLKNDPGPQQLPKFDQNEHPASFSANPKNYAQPSNDNITQQFEDQEKIDLALGYTFVDVKDEENEGNGGTEKQGVREKEKKDIICTNMIPRTNSHGKTWSVSTESGFSGIPTSAEIRNQGRNNRRFMCSYLDGLDASLEVSGDVGALDQCTALFNR